MSRYIDAKKIKQTFCAECNHTLKCEDCDIDYHFRHATAADVVEVRHGRWIIEDKYTDYRTERCSACGFAANRAYIQDIWHYCPNCGAKMDEVGE